MRMITRQSLKFLLPKKFSIEFEENNHDILKDRVLNLAKPDVTEDKSGKEIHISNFNVSVMNVFWNIFSIRFFSESAEFEFRDATSQNVFTFVSPIVLFLAHVFVFKEFEFKTAFLSSMMVFSFFFIFFSIGRYFIFKRVISNINSN